MIGTRNFLNKFLLALIFVALAACSPSTENAPTATPQAAAQEQQAEEPQAPAEATSTEEPTPTASSADGPVVLEPPSSRSGGGLSATDPTTVDLASGKPKLVEFFAFW